ncbi:FkbM family methyltransferase, partial [Candidatus Peregrinibacteria bacterium]|nr:FkbM family methyltransferase [Candidatus Peregrinibacteria bacterium]
DGNTSLRVHKSPGQHSIDIKTQERGNLKMVFLDYILTKDEYSNVGFIKIDVEGYEHKVLKGMSAIVKNSPNIVIQLEYAPQHLADYNFVFEEFADLIKRMNLKVEYWDLKDSLKKHIHDIFWLNDPTVVNDFKEGIKYSRNLILTRQDG